MSEIGDEMMLGLGRVLRRRRSFNAAVDEEVNYLVEQHGQEALSAARTRLRSETLRPDQRKVLAAAAKQLER